MKVITTNLLNRFWKNGIKPVKDSITGKLDNSKVINNLLATVAGYALDARQGKILDDKIAALNSKLYDSGWIDLTSRVSYRIKNGFCTINASSAGHISLAQSLVTLGQLPPPTFPGQLIRVVGTPMDNNGYLPQFIINPDGKITGQYLKGSGSINYWAFTVTYPV